MKVITTGLVAKMHYHDVTHDACHFVANMTARTRSSHQSKETIVMKAMNTKRVPLFLSDHVHEFAGTNCNTTMRNDPITVTILNLIFG